MVAGQLQDPHNVQAIAPHILKRHPNGRIAAAVVHYDNLIRKPRSLPVEAPLEVPTHFQHSVELHMHLRVAASSAAVLLANRSSDAPFARSREFEKDMQM